MGDDLAEKRKTLKNLIDSDNFHIKTAHGYIDSVDKLPAAAIDQLTEIIHGIKERQKRESMLSPEEQQTLQKQQYRNNIETYIKRILKQDTQKLKIGETEKVECPICRGELIYSRPTPTQSMARCKTEGCLLIVVE
jgi:hypothetical protein